MKSTLYARIEFFPHSRTHSSMAMAFRNSTAYACAIDKGPAPDAYRFVTPAAIFCLCVVGLILASENAVGASLLRLVANP